MWTNDEKSPVSIIHLIICLHHLKQCLTTSHFQPMLLYAYIKKDILHKVFKVFTEVHLLVFVSCEL